MDYYGWRPYVSVAARRWQAAGALARRRKNGQTSSPVLVDGRKIATTFWGKAWCTNLERYSDFSNRLPRGRTYVRSGSVIDLQIAPGAVTALVSGSDTYEIRIGVTAVAKARWRAICQDCTGGIDSLVELLQGRLSAGVMTRICEPKTGLFPEPRELSFACSCPDWASMCKHVAAALYGVGARLDEQPELLFLLRGVDQQDLIANAGTGLRHPAGGRAEGKVLDAEDLSGLFGIEMAEPDVPRRARAARKQPPPRAAVPAAPAAKPARRASPPKAKAKVEARPVAPVTPKAPARRLMTAKQRAAVVARMKKYWRERRKRRREKPL